MSTNNICFYGELPPPPTPLHKHPPPSYLELKSFQYFNNIFMLSALIISGFKKQEFKGLSKSLWSITVTLSSFDYFIKYSIDLS